MSKNLGDVEANQRQQIIEELRLLQSEWDGLQEIAIESRHGAVVTALVGPLELIRARKDELVQLLARDEASIRGGKEIGA